MSYLNESIVEDAALTWFEELGYSARYAAAEAAERGVARGKGAKTSRFTA